MRGPMAAFYGGSQLPEPVQATAEDTAAGQVTFANGALGQWLLSVAGHGEGYFSRRFYGSDGSLQAPADRTGRPVLYARAAHLQGDAGGPDRPLEDADVRALLPGFSLDEPTARLFGASLLTSYDLPFEEIDRKLLALELEDFGRAILDTRPPEVDGSGRTGGGGRRVRLLRVLAARQGSRPRRGGQRRGRWVPARDRCGTRDRGG